MKQPQTILNIEQTFPPLQLNQLAEQENRSTLSMKQLPEPMTHFHNLSFHCETDA